MSVIGSKIGELRELTEIERKLLEPETWVYEHITKHKLQDEDLSCLIPKEKSMSKSVTKKKAWEALKTIAQYCYMRDCYDCEIKHVCERLEMKESPFYIISDIMEESKKD